MASESRPSRQPAAPHATAADLVLEALAVLRQPGSDLVRPRTSFDVGGAVSEPKFLGFSSWKREQGLAVKLVSGMKALYPAVERLMQLGRTCGLEFFMHGFVFFLYGLLMEDSFIFFLYIRQPASFFLSLI